MFIYSVRASTVRFIGVICIALASLVLLVAVVPSYSTVQTFGEAEETEGNVTVSYDKVRSSEDVIAFLRQFGWEVEPASLETADVTLPGEFDKVFTVYNDLQRRQGLDLTKFKNRSVTRYTYALKNFPGATGTVLANVLVYRNRVIGGDICSADVSGFVTGFTGQQ